MSLDPRVILPNYRLVSPAGDAAQQVWSPPADVIAAGENAIVHYDMTAPVAAGVQWSPTPAMLAFRNAIVHAWDGVTSGGIQRDAARATEASTFDAHRTSKAVDYMLRAGPQRFAVGSALANWLVLNADLLGVDYVLFAGREWSASHNGPKWERYTGVDFHSDHVHSELNDAALAWPASVMSARVAQALANRGGASSGTTIRNVAIVGGVGVVAALTAWWFDRRR